MAQDVSGFRESAVPGCADKLSPRLKGPFRPEVSDSLQGNTRGAEGSPNADRATRGELGPKPVPECV